MLTGVRSIAERSWLIGLLVGVLSICVVHHYPMVWDEGYTVERVEVLKKFLGRCWRADGAERRTLLGWSSLRQHWRFSKEEPDGHGPFYAMLSLAGHQLTHPWVTPLVSYRVGNVMLFALVASHLFGTIRQYAGVPTAWLSIGLLSLIPRVVPELHFALIDGPLFSLALLAWSCFVRTELGASQMPWRVWPHRLGFGITIGLAMATKFTGWFLPLPYILWTLWQSLGGPNWKSTWMTLIVGGITAGLSCLLCNVGWWPDPIEGVRVYFESNLTRAKTIPIPTLYFGQKYPFSLPWHNTLVWTVIALPMGMLALGIVGIFGSLRQYRTAPLGVLLVLNWLLLIIVRALPQAPGHDGTRQIIISFGFLSLLAGAGWSWLTPWPQTRGPQWRLGVWIMGLASILEAAGACIAYHPQQLSYYSPIVGNLSGAVRMGFEPTYFWDGLTPDVLRWLEANTAPTETVLFTNNPESFDYLERWGVLRVQRQKTPGFERCRWVIVQHRPGLFTPEVQAMLEHDPPAFTKRLFGVPLISVYPFTAYANAHRTLAPDGGAAKGTSEHRNDSKENQP